jgi:hypothetical protein
VDGDRKTTIGQRVNAVVDMCIADGWPVVDDAKGSTRSAVIRCARWSASVTVAPAKWLGVEFLLLDAEGMVTLWHQIDTDLYNLEDPKNDEFAVEIEDDIVQFLEALRAGEVTVSRDGGLSMVFPARVGFYRLRKGRLMISGKPFLERADAERDGRFVPLRCQEDA